MHVMDARISGRESLSEVRVSSIDVNARILTAMKGTVMPFEIGEFATAINSYPGMTDAAASSSIASIIAHQEIDKYTDIVGQGWQASTNYVSWGQVYVSGNYADLGKPPPIESYYLGYQGNICFSAAYGATTVDRPCQTLYDDLYVPLVRLPTAALSLSPYWSTCTLHYG